MSDIEQRPKRARKAVAPAAKPAKVAYSMACSASADAAASDDEESIIMQLSIQPDAVPAPFSESDALLGEPAIDPPNAYNSICHDTFSSLPCEIDVPRAAAPSGASAVSAHRVVSLLKDFEEKNKNNEWPSSTSIHCYWCSHRFDNAPLGIPLKHVDNKFYVFGCFCSLACAAAYNFAGRSSYDEVIERYQLINLMARRLGHEGRVRPAPDRLALKMFGGHIDIEEFRAFSAGSKVIGVNFPPMMTLTQQVEEFNECDVASVTDSRYIPIDAERVNRYKDRMSVRRAPARGAAKNTLDDTMNIRAEPPHTVHGA